MLKWIKWYFYDSRICKHSKTKWVMRECGMGKVKICCHCGKCLEVI